MAYATIAALIALWGPEEAAMLSTRGASRDPADMEAAVLEGAICYAGSEIDSYLGSRYAVPLAGPVPEIVTAVTADIARYRLTGGDVDEKDPVLSRYKTALAWLRDIASGTASLPGLPGQGEQGEGVAITPGERAWGGASCRA